MNQYCKYHPTTPALWFCQHDGVHLCSQCVESRDDQHLAARCLLCNGELVYPPDPHSQAPLRQHLEAVLALPLRKDWALVVLGFALLTLFIPPVWPALPVLAVLLLPLLVLAGWLVEQQGRAESVALTLPRLRELFSQGVRWRQALWLALPILGLAGLVLLAAQLDLVLALLLLAGGGLLVAACWLAVIVAGASPAAFAGLPRYLLGASREYGLVALFQVLSALLLLAGLRLADDLMPLAVLQLLAGMALSAWLLLLAGSCGTLLLRHGRGWGWLGRPATRVRQPLAQRRQWLQLCGGRYDKVLLSLAMTVKSGRASLDDWRHYQQLLLLQGEQEQWQRQLEPYLEVLCHHAAWAEALAVLQRQRQAWPQWLPHSPALRLALAEGIAEREPKLAIVLLKDLHGSHRDFIGLGDAYLLLARLLAEQFSLHDKAEQYLRFIEKTLPEARLRQQAQALRQQWAQA